MKYVLFFVSLIFAIACNDGASTPTGVKKDAPTGQTIKNPRDNSPAENPEIIVDVEGQGPAVAYLIGTFAGNRFRADSAQISAQGHFEFRRDEPYRPGFYIVVLPGNRGFQMLIDKDQTFTMKTKLVNLDGEMVVEGSIDNELLYRNLKFEKDFKSQYNRVANKKRTLSPSDPEWKNWDDQAKQLLESRKQHLEELSTEAPNSFFTAFKISGQNPDIPAYTKPDGTRDTMKYLYHYRTQLWDNVDLSDDRLLATPVIPNKLQRYMKELTIQGPDSLIQSIEFLMNRVPVGTEMYKYIANWITLQYEPTETKLMDPQAIFVHMIENYFTYDKAFWADSAEVYSLQIRAGEMSASLVGKKGPDVKAPGLDGKTYSIYDSKKPYVVVYMYNPECEHCMEETPKLVNYYNQNKNLIDVYAIAIDTDDTQWRNYVQKNRMQEWTNVHDPTNKSIYGKYFVDVTPEIYVLNPDRTLIAKNLKTFQIQEMIDRDKRK
jgi:thiol-disulfide isomerase/thioredoxin